MSMTKNILMSWMKNILKIKLAHERWWFLLKNIGTWMIDQNIIIFWLDFRLGLNVKWCVCVIALSHILIHIFFSILIFSSEKHTQCMAFFFQREKMMIFCCWLELEHNKAACWNEQSLISESITFPVCALNSFHDRGQVRKEKLRDLKWEMIKDKISKNALRLNFE